MRRVHSKPAAMRGPWLALAAIACLGLGAPIVVAAASGSPDGQPAAERLSPDQLTAPIVGDAVIGPQDLLTIRVFEVKDLSFENEQVDSSGELTLPLIGRLHAAGKTTAQLEDEIVQRLSKYLQSPQVSVSITQSASQKVTVEGNVKNPGVYLVRGQTTLMMAVAMAGGVDGEADTHKVAVIRLEDGVRKAATVDYAAIKKGQAPDPLIQGNDDVVVGESTAKMVWANIVRNLPILTLMTYVH